jgi:hypothetical protein
MAHCRRFLRLKHREEGNDIIVVAFLFFKYKKEGNGIMVVAFFVAKQHLKKVKVGSLPSSSYILPSIVP